MSGPGTGASGRVVAASNRAAAGVYSDRTGPSIVEWLRQRGYDTPDPIVLPDGPPVGDALRQAVADEVNVVITTGGTGISPTDRTPEVTAEVLDHPIPGLAEALRSSGLPEVPTAVLSRGLAGVSGRTLIVNLPGSRGGVRDGLGVLDGVLDHAVEQIRGVDHVRVPEVAAPEADTGRADTAAAEWATVQSEVDSTGGVAGRAGSVLRAEVTDEPVDLAALAEQVEQRAAGAAVTFAGVVRDHDSGRTVRELEYVGHPSAADVIAEVASDVAARFEDVRAMSVAHRVGLLAIGDVALGCAVSAAHRAQAFHACSELVDEVKRRLPIWKRQVFADGTEEWVNCP